MSSAIPGHRHHYHPLKTLNRTTRSAPQLISQSSYLGKNTFPVCQVIKGIHLFSAVGIINLPQSNNPCSKVDFAVCVRSVCHTCQVTDLGNKLIVWICLSAKPLVYRTSTSKNRAVIFPAGMAGIWFISPENSSLGGTKPPLSTGAAFSGRA